MEALREYHVICAFILNYTFTARCMHVVHVCYRMVLFVAVVCAQCVPSGERITRSYNNPQIHRGEFTIVALFFHLPVLPSAVSIYDEQFPCAAVAQ